MEAGKIGIVVLNYNTPDDVERCIDSIYKTCTSHFKIYLVDNCSTDNSLFQFEQKYASKQEIDVIVTQKNGGFSYGNNVGAQAAIADGVKYLLFTNSDIIFKEHSIYQMKKIFEQKEYYNVGIVGPQISTLDAKKSEFARSKLTLDFYIKTKKPLCFFVKEEKFERYQKIVYDNNLVYTFDGMVSGCCFMMKTETYIKNKGFDERLFLYGEEDVWAYKLEKQKQKSAIVGTAHVFHNHHSSIKKKGLAFTRFYQWLSPLIVIKYYGDYNDKIFKFVCAINIITWNIMSVFKKSYRNMSSKFKKNIKELMKGKL